jgi:hypothetical protein
LASLFPNLLAELSAIHPIGNTFYNFASKNAANGALEDKNGNFAVYIVFNNFGEKQFQPAHPGFCLSIAL